MSVGLDLSRRCLAELAELSAISAAAAATSVPVLLVSPVD